MDKGNTETVMFGATKEAPKTTAAEEAVQSQESKPKEELPKETKETKTPTLGDEGSKPEVIQEDKTKTEAPKEQEKAKEAIKVNFQPKKEESTKPSDSPKEETQAINEKQVLDFLKKNGIEAAKLDDLAPKVILNPQVEKFRKYVEETNRDVKDFYNLNRDWNKESKETRIKEFLRYENPNLSEDVIQQELETYLISEDDRDEMDDRELRKMEVALNKLDSKALSYLTQKSQEFAIPEKAVNKSSQRSQEEIDASYKDYRDSRDKSLDNFNDIKFEIEGLGEITIPIDTEDKQLVSKNTETVEAFISRWADDQNNMNTESLVEDNLWGIKPIREKIITSMIEQANALFMEKFSKENRNVNLNDAPKETVKTTKAGLMIQGSEAQQKDSGFGRPLIGG